MAYIGNLLPFTTTSVYITFWGGWRQRSNRAGDWEIRVWFFLLGNVLGKVNDECGISTQFLFMDDMGEFVAVSEPM